MVNWVAFFLFIHESPRRYLSAIREIHLVGFSELEVMHKPTYSEYILYEALIVFLFRNMNIQCCSY